MAGRDTQRGASEAARPLRVRLAPLLGVATRTMGIARDVAIAAVFRRDETDTFFVAFTLPSALRLLLGDVVTSRGLAPLVSKKLRQEGEEAALVLYSRLRAAAGGLLSIATTLGIVLAQPLTELLAGGYRRRYGEFERTVWLTMTLFPYLLFAGLATIGAAALHVKKRATASLEPLIFSASVLLATLLLPPLLDSRGLDRAQAIAVGAGVGGLAALVLDWRARKAIGWATTAVVELRLPEIRDVARRAAPAAIALGPFYLELFVSRRLLSEMRPGAQSAFWWAMRICEVSQAVVVSVLALAPPSGGRSGQPAAEGAATSRALRLALFASIPMACLVSALARPIVVAALQRGAFDAAAAYETARALAWQGAAIWMAAVLREVAAGLYAADRRRTPLVLALSGAVAFIAVALALRGRMGQPAISAALLASSATQLALAIPLLKRAIPDLTAGPIVTSAARTLAASLVAVGVATSCAWGLTLGAGPGAVARLLPGVLGVVVFVATFVGAAHGLRSPELDLVLRSARRRQGRV